MEPGWIYVLVNSSIPGLLKVGRTTRPPAERVAELSGATGVATPFVLAFDHEFADCVLAEQEIHAELDRRNLRVAQNREFFRGSAADTVRVVLDAAARHEPGLERVPEPSAAEYIRAGDRSLYGKGETLQDTSEAVGFYRLAQRRGSVVALERQGFVYGQLPGKNRGGQRKAMRYLKEGVRRGNYFCYCEMARLYAAQGHIANYQKVWGLFFARRREALCAEAEADGRPYINALRRYITTTLDLGLQPAHIDELRADATTLMETIAATMERARDIPDTHQCLATALRWSYEHLIQTQPDMPGTPVKLQLWQRLTRRAVANGA